MNKVSFQNTQKKIQNTLKFHSGWEFKKSDG